MQSITHAGNPRLASPNSELTLVAGLLGRAFVDDPGIVFSDPLRARRERWLPQLYYETARYSRAVGGVELVEGRGAALWIESRTEPSVLEVFRHRLWSIPFAMGFGPWWRLMRHEAYCSSRVRQLCPKRYGYLWILGVDPAAQGQGYGRRAVEATLQSVADRGHEICILKTETPNNVSFYQSLGFRCIDEQVVPASNLRYWLFQRALR